MTTRNSTIPAPQRSRTYIFATASDAAVAVGANGMADELGCGEYVSRIRISAKVAPVGAALIVRLRIIDPTDGSVVATIGSFNLADGAKYAAEQTFTAALIGRAQALEADVTQVGSGTAGTGLSLAVD